MVCSRWTTDGVACPPAGSFALHRGHRAGVVPALAPVLLVRRVTSVLAAVVAAELLARLDLASAPRVLAVHPTSNPAPRRWTAPLGARCMPPARCVNLSGFTGSVPSCVHPPLRNRRACPRRRGERPTQRSTVHRRSEHERRAAGTARRPRDRTISIEERRSVPIAVGGELRID
jgi:hypothetical protein